MSHTWVHTKADFPKNDHWVVMEFSYRTHPDPYRELDNVTEYHIDYIVYDNEQEWKDEIVKRTLEKDSRNNFVAFKSTKPVSTQTNVNVIIN